jgi:glycosyl transferase family 87
MSEGRNLARASRRVVVVFLCCLLPVGVLITMFRVGLDANSLAVDFHHELYPQAAALIAGDNPYPTGDFEPRVGGNLVWPPIAAVIVAPLTVLPVGTADVVIAVLGLVCFALALRVIGVRDWRVYGVCCLWPPVAGEMRVSHLTPLLALLAAVAWRERERRTVPGASLGLAVGLKFFLWPLVLWLASIRRPRAAALAAVIAGASWLLVLPYTGLDEYLRALLRLGSYFDQDSYTIFGLLVQSGASDILARSITSIVGCALLVGTWKYRSFTLAVASALTLSPIVWLDYYALTALPLAIARPRLSIAWFAPIAMWGAAGTGLGIGTPEATARVLVIAGVVLSVSFAAERSMSRDRSDRVPSDVRRPTGIPVHER